MRDRRHLDRHLGEIDAVGSKAVDHRTERLAQRVFRTMLETQIRTAMRRTAAGFDLLSDAVAVRDLLHAVVEQPATKLVAERIPHDRVHADQSRREMPDGKELHE